MAGGIHGAGDMVAIVAQPIAKMIDAMASTNIQGCSGCEKRREALNKMFPIGDKKENLK